MIDIKVNYKTGNYELFDSTANQVVEFDSKNPVHVATVKKWLLKNAAQTLGEAIEQMENGKPLEDIASDKDDAGGRDTYWLDADFDTERDYDFDDLVEINPFKEKCGQLCLQVDEFGNWY